MKKSLFRIKPVRNIAMLKKVKAYSYPVERIICYYISFLKKAPMHLFRTYRKNIVSDIDYMSSVVEELYAEGMFSYFYEYNACRRFLKVFRKIALKWYWTYLFL